MSILPKMRWPIRFSAGARFRVHHLANRLFSRARLPPSRTRASREPRATTRPRVTRLQWPQRTASQTTARRSFGNPPKHHQRHEGHQRPAPALRSNVRILSVMFISRRTGNSRDRSWVASRHPTWRVMSGLRDAT